MKNTVSVILLFFLTFFTVEAYGQPEIVRNAGKLLSSAKSKAIFSLSFGGDDLYSSEDIEGGPSYSGRGFYSFEAQITFKISKRFDIVPGLSFTGNNFNVAPAFRPTLLTKQTINVFSMPVYIRYHFLKYFYISGGPTFNINGGDRDLNGIGAGFNFGGEYSLKNSIIINFGPFIRYQGLVPWKNYKLSNRGVTLGIGYQF
jgi:hypothetical protein